MSSRMTKIPSQLPDSAILPPMTGANTGAMPLIEPTMARIPASSHYKYAVQTAEESERKNYILHVLIVIYIAKEFLHVPYHLA